MKRARRRRFVGRAAELELYGASGEVRAGDGRFALLYVR
jgi:hypothetical protein